MSKEKFIDAALLRLQSEMLERKTIIDVFLDNPLDSVRDGKYLDDIIEHAKYLAVCENTYRVLHTNYVAKATPPTPASPPTPPPSGSVLVTPENSPTMRRAMEAKERKEKSTRRTRKKKGD